MKNPIPPNADLRQLRTQAKERLRTLRDDPARAGAKLADAQLEIARDHGYPSWPALVTKIETPVLIAELRTSIESGDAERLERLLKSKRSARRLLDRPLFAFDSPALIQASRHPKAERLLTILVRYGADPNIRSTWWAGGFGALDGASEATAKLLLSLGTEFDVWSASAHGRVDVLGELLDRDPSSVNAPGGDGGRPLHFASTPEVVELLIARGADLEARDVDHEGTPVQHHVRRSDLLRVLLHYGAQPDIFTAIALDEIDLLRRILENDPDSLDARIGDYPFATEKSDGGHIYIYSLGEGKTPLQMAIESNARNVLPEILRRARPIDRLLAAAWMEDAETVTTLIRDDPRLINEFDSHSRAVADAAQAGRTETVRLLLEAGFDPLGRGLDTGTALHTACWYGYADVVNLLLGQVPLDLRDDVHESPPLGWATHGAQWCRNPRGDYVAVAESLLKAGADPNAPANRDGITMLAQAGEREDMRAVLRRYGAV